MDLKALKLKTYTTVLSRAIFAAACVILAGAAMMKVSGFGNAKPLFYHGFGAAIAAIGCYVFHHLFELPVIRQMQNGDCLAVWPIHRREIAVLEQNAFEKKWEIISDWAIYLFVTVFTGFVFAMAAFGHLEGAWVIYPLAGITLLVSGLALRFLLPAGTFSDNYQEVALVGLTHAYWRNRLIQYSQSSRAKPMRIEEHPNGSFLVAVSESSHEVYHCYEFYLRIPAGKEPEAVEVLELIRKHLAQDKK